MGVVIPVIDNLRQDRWSQLTPDEKLETLQELEDNLSSLEHRPRCILERIPTETLAEGDNAQTLMGLHVGDNTERILLNPSLLADDTPPFVAVETYFHEARHSYQDHIADHPELAENIQQAEDFYKAKNGGYLAPEEHPRHYPFQPTEIDARHNAQVLTLQTYEQFGEMQDYIAYQNTDDYSYTSQLFTYERLYIDEARQRVDREYQRSQGISPGSENQEEISDVASKSIQTEPATEQSQDYDYFQGYGY